MPVMLNNTIIAANATNANLVAGSAFEYARVPAVMSAALNGAAAGLLANIQAGPNIVAESYSVPVINSYPVIPDNFYFNEALDAGDRIVLRVQNTTGAPVGCYYVVQLSGRG